MKYLIILIAFFSFHLSITQTGSIKITVENLNTDKKGNVRIAIYKSESTFLEDGKEAYWAVVKAEGNSVTYKFSKIPVGTYAIAVFQDVNKNGKLDKNMLGAPTERYGFSKNIYGNFSAPDFEDVSFTVNSGKMRILTIRIK